MSTIDRQALIEALSRLVTPGDDPQGTIPSPLARRAVRFTPSTHVHD
jgi:hypothetical protein